MSNLNKTKEYKVVSGTSYSTGTDAKVIQILESARINQSRIRVFYGDIETGKVWLEENDVCGKVGRSTGSIKVPLLIPTANSLGGGSILDNCIVRILVGGVEKYKHPLYQAPVFQTVKSSMPDFPVEVQVKDENGYTGHARFKTEAKAARWVAFMNGERMGK